MTFQVLCRGIAKEDYGPLVRQLASDGLIELLFRDLEVYRLALKFYAISHEVIAGKAAAGMLRKAIEKHLLNRLTVSEDNETKGQCDE